jgi:hypothetical protein
VSWLEQQLAAAAAAEEMIFREGAAGRAALVAAEARVCELLQTHAWEKNSLKQVGVV